MYIKKLKNILLALILTIILYAVWLFIFGIIILDTYSPNQCIADNCYPFSWWEDLMFFLATFVSFIIIGVYFFKKFVFIKANSKTLVEKKEYYC